MRTSHCLASWRSSSAVAARAAGAGRRRRGRERETTTENVVDFGVRGTWLKGDGARYERYRDLGNGLFLETASAESRAERLVLHRLGRPRRTARSASVRQCSLPGKFKGRPCGTRFPMLLSRTTLPCSSIRRRACSADPDLVQTQVQVTALAHHDVVGQFGRPFDMKTRRYIGRG